MMSYLMESSSQRRPVGRSLTSFVTSLLLQGIAVAIMILLPLMATDAIPVPQGIMTFMTPPPPAPQPPPPPPSPAQAQPVSLKPVVTDSPDFVVPVNVPNEISEEIDFFSVPGVIESVHGGVLGEIVGSLQNTPPPPPAEQELVRVGGDIRAPMKIKTVQPVYPEIARQAHVHGFVILEAVIDPQGNVTNVRVLRSIALLDQAAIDAVRQWKYEPTLLNGIPVPIVMTVTVGFKLR